mgnify:CR=1 FL=1
MARQIGSCGQKSSAFRSARSTQAELNQAIETGKLLSGKDARPVDGLTDSGAGSASAMRETRRRQRKSRTQPCGNW